MPFLAKIECGDNWSFYQNHESSLSDEEMKVLVKQVLLLEGMETPPNTMPQAFKNLSQSMQNNGSTITITKGIHQREAKVHFNICIGNSNPIYHVFVIAGADALVTSAPVKWGAQKYINKTVSRTLFNYKTSGLSIIAGGNVSLLWPSQFTTLSELEKPIGRKRGTSFSQGNSKAEASKPPTHTELGAL